MVDELRLEVEEASQVLALGRCDCHSHDVLHNLVHHLDGIEGWVAQQLQTGLDQTAGHGKHGRRMHQHISIG